MEIKPLRDEAQKWDEFVRANSAGTLFHLIGWKKVLEKTFGYESLYFYSEDRGKITGILPLFAVRGLLGGKALISTPFAVYGGIIAESEESKFLLLNEARRFAENQGATYIELKSINRGFDDLPVKELYVTFFQTLHKNPNVNFELIPRKTRRMIRVAIKNNLEAEVCSGNGSLNDFFNIYASSLRNLGTPVFPKQLFTNLFRYFKDESFIFFVKHQGKRVGAVLTFSYQDCLLPYYGGSYKEYNKLAINNFMYWKLMEYGCLNGLKRFDFGRSKISNSGSYQFKKHWGMCETKLEYQYYLLRGAEIPNLSPNNPKFKLLSNAWKLLPLTLTKLIGPKVVRYFP